MDEFFAAQEAAIAKATEHELEVGQHHSIDDPTSPSSPFGCCAAEETVTDVSLYVWFRLWGNPDGIPVLFVHGGPGNCVADYGDVNKKFFDASRWARPNCHRVLTTCSQVLGGGSGPARHRKILTLCAPIRHGY